MTANDPWVADVHARFERPLVLYATRICADPAAADDVVQETFLRLLKQPRESIDGRLAKWLYTVCRNVALDRGRKEHAMHTRERTIARESARAAAPSDAQAIAIARDESSAALRALERLPAKQQEALRLKFQGGLSYAEIGRVMDEAAGTVGWLIHEGLKALRARMGVSEGQVKS